MQKYYFSSPIHSGEIMLAPDLDLAEVANQVAAMWGIEASSVKVSLEEPDEVRAANSLAALHHNYNRAISGLSTGFDAPTWPLQAAMAERLLADNKDKKALRTIESMLTAKELGASKTKVAAAIVLATKIADKYEAYTNKVAKINGLYRQAQIDLKAESDALKRNAINNEFEAAIST